MIAVVLDGLEDFDGDGVSNQVEFTNGTNPNQEETEEAYLRAIEEFQDANYVLVPIEGTFSDDNIGNITVLNNGGVAYYNITQKKIFYWYEGNLISKVHDGTEIIDFINTGYGVNRYLKGYYYKLSGGTIEKVSIAHLSEDIFKEHVPSLFRARYPDESKYIIDSIELSDYSPSYKYTACRHIFADGGGIYYSQDRYVVTYHRASSTNGNQSTASYTPKINFYRKDGVEKYNPLYTDKKNSNIILDSVGGRDTHPIVSFNYYDDNGNYITSLFNAIDHSLIEYDTDFYSSSRISSQGHILYGDRKVHNFNDDTFTGKEESGGGITTWNINNRGDVLDSQTIGRRFHDRETGQTTWVHQNVNVRNALEPYILRYTTKGLGDIPMEGGSEANTLESPLPIIAGHAFDGDSSTPDGVGVLLPVDLEVEYTESTLDASKEDSGVGGIIPLKRMEGGENKAPLMSLLLHPLNLEGALFRLKFNKGGKYKIYRNHDETNEVVSEQTTFNASQLTRLYVAGDNLSQSLGAEEIMMQVSAGGNGNWIDADSIKATVVQVEFQVDVRTFIPYNWVDVPAPGYYDIVAEGDDRDYDNTLAGTYRIAQREVYNPYPQYVPRVGDRLVEAEWEYAGQTVHYSESDVVNFDNSVKHSGQLTNSYIDHSASPKNFGYADLGEVEATIITEATNDTELHVRFKGSAKEPIIQPHSEPIDWNVSIAIAILDPLNPTFSIEGKQDGFPAYEFYINANHPVFPITEVYKYEPPNDRGVLSLISGVNDEDITLRADYIEK